MWATLVLSVSVVVALVITRLWPAPGGAVQDVARACAVLAFVWAVVAATALRVRGRSVLETSRSTSFVGATHVVALLLGVVSAIVQLVVLTMRVIFVTVDLVNPDPWRDVAEYGFGPHGLWSIGFLVAACATALMSTGDRRLGTCLFWGTAIFVSWWCLLAPPLRSTPTGGIEQTSTTLVLLAALSGLLAITGIGVSWIERRRLARAGNDDPMNRPFPWPGLSLSEAGVGVAVIVLVGYHLAVPLALGRSGFRVTALVTTASALVAGLGCFLLLLRNWSGALGNAAMWLTSLGLCGLPTVVVPSHPMALAERYPMTFNAMIVGLAGATGLWTRMACVWGRRPDGGQSWTDTSRLIPYARRFAFLTAALALVVGVMMAMWPRWPAIATMDDSMGRVTAGFAANLFLLAVMLWCSRRLHKLTYQILTVLTVASAAGFLIVRMLPFTSRFG